MALNPTHLDNCTREITRWSKAVRLIHVLERNLPDLFPEPDFIEPSRKPYDLQIIWEADNPEHSIKLRKRITKSLSWVQLNFNWRPDMKGHFVLRGRIRLGNKTTMNLQFLVASGLQG